MYGFLCAYGFKKDFSIIYDIEIFKNMHSADHNSYKLCLIRLRNGFSTHCVVHNCISVTSDKRLRIALNLGE